MAWMTTNYADLKESDDNFTPLPNGTYEVIANTVKEDATPSGAEYLAINLVVRNDLDNVPELANSNAKYHNRIIFYKLFKSKNTNEYSTNILQYVMKGFNIPEGTEINSIDEFIAMIKGKPVRVVVDLVDHEYNGSLTKQNEIKPWHFKTTKFPNVQHTFKENKATVNDFANGANPYAQPGREIDISDDQLPF